MPAEACTDLRHPPPPPRPRRKAPGAALAAALTAALLLGACGGGGGDSRATPDGGDDRASSLSLTPPAAGELLDAVRRTLRDRAAAGEGGLALVGSGIAPVAATPVGGAESPAHSTSAVQEAGVDEPDLLKTNGQHLYALHVGSGNARNARLAVHERTAEGALRSSGTLMLDGDAYFNPGLGGLLLHPQRPLLAVLSEVWQRHDVCTQDCPRQPMLTGDPQAGWLQQWVGVQRVDVAGPGVPQAGKRVLVEGQMVGARQVGDTLVVVTTHRPWLRVDNWPTPMNDTQREAALQGMTAGELLPRVRVGNQPERLLVEEDQCLMQRGNASLSVAFTTVTVFDLGNADMPFTSRCFYGGTEAVYMTPTHLYVATTRMAYVPRANQILYPEDMSTDIHRFELPQEPGGHLRYHASGGVQGHLGWDPLHKSHRLSEWNGDLRVLTFTGRNGWAVLADAQQRTKPPSPARLTVLRQTSNATLQTVATLPNTQRPQHIGKPDEQVHGVRFDGPRGYVVTFQQVDPLYVLDLSDPTDPFVAGELEVPGVSDHLYTLGGPEAGLLLGVGREVNEQGLLGGVLVSLFDVSDPAAPRQLAALAFGDNTTQTALDHSRQGINWLDRAGSSRIALPATTRVGGGWLEWHSALQRFEVDLAARSLRALPALNEATLSMDEADISLQRSVQVGDHVYFLRGDLLTGHLW